MGSGTGSGTYANSISDYYFFFWTTIDNVVFAIKLMFISDLHLNLLIKKHKDLNSPRFYV